MKKRLDDLLYLLPVMFYYLLESLLVGVFVYFIWNFIVSDGLGLERYGYFVIVGLYWIIKMLMFDMFKMISGLSVVAEKTKKIENSNDEV